MVFCGQANHRVCDKYQAIGITRMFYYQGTIFLKGYLSMTYQVSTAANLNDGFVVAINIEAKDGKADVVADILERLIARTMAEEGVKFFMPYRSPTNPLSFFIYELYVNEAGWDAHNNSEHFLSTVEELLPRVKGRERIPFVPFV